MCNRTGLFLSSIFQLLPNLVSNTSETTYSSFQLSLVSYHFSICSNHFYFMYFKALILGVCMLDAVIFLMHWSLYHDKCLLLAIYKILPYSLVCLILAGYIVLCLLSFKSLNIKWTWLTEIVALWDLVGQTQPSTQCEFEAHE